MLESPVAILVDFKQFLTETDGILTKYWELYGVDSITGNWDYKESALFGYVSGKVIESYCNFFLSPADKVVATTAGLRENQDSHPYPSRRQDL